MSTIPSGNSPSQSNNKRTPACLSMLIGMGVLGLVLLIAALAGNLIFPDSSRSPAVTEAPPPSSPVSATATQASQAASPAVETTVQQPAATPLDTPPASVEAATPPADNPGISYLLTVNIAALNVRSGPGTMYPIIITYPKGTQLLAIGRDADASWFVISLSAEQQGWVSTALVTYDFDRYILPVFPAPPIEYTTPTPYGAAILVPPELIGSQPLAPIQPVKRLVSLLVAFL